MVCAQNDAEHDRSGICRERIYPTGTGHKEKQIILTDDGKAYAQEILTPVFEAEEKAIGPFLKTMLVEQTEDLAREIKSEFDKLIKRN